MKRADYPTTAATRVQPVQVIDGAGAVGGGGGAPGSASYMHVVGALAMMGGNDFFVSPYHFTAVYQATTAVDLTGGFPPITDVTQFVTVMQVDTAGVVSVHYPTTHVFAWDPANNRLTITGATFAATDVFQVIIRGADRATSLPENARLVLEQNQSRYGSDDAGITMISAAQAFTDAWVDLGSEISMFGFTTCAFYLTLDINDDSDLQFRVRGKHESEGTEEYSLPIETVGTGVVSVEDQYWEFTDDADQLIIIPVETNGAVPYLQAQIRRGVDGAATDSEVDAAYFVKGV